MITYYFIIIQYSTIIQPFNNMPNFCYNTLTLSGNYLSLNDFWKENRDEDLELFISFQNSVPVIEGESCDEKWNTKWNARDIEFSENISLTHDLPTDISTIEYTFSTAWAPPTLWLKSIIRKYYNIDFINCRGKWSPCIFTQDSDAQDIQSQESKRTYFVNYK